MGGIFGLLALLISIYKWFERPISLTKKQIIGGYRIDKNFYPGKNANWQYDHYRFTITQSDSIYLYVTGNDSMTKIYRSKLYL